MKKRVGILTSGGDCPGLNATIRGVAKALYARMGDNVEIVGIANGYSGLINGDYREMNEDDFRGILTLGGTILGTKRTPFKLMRVVEDDNIDKVAAMKKTYKAAKLDCLLCLGGNGTHKTANLLSQEGLNIIGLPKTIDNDIYGTDFTFGFHTAVDIATEELLPEGAAQSYRGKSQLCIDHHPSNEGYAQQTCLDADASACGEIIYHIIREWGVWSQSIAQALYIAIATDCGGFLYSNTTPETHRIAAELMEHLDVRKVNKHFFKTKRFVELKLESRLLESEVFFHNGKVCIGKISLQDKADLGAGEGDCEELSSFAATIEGVGCAATLRELAPDKWKISLRTVETYADANHICNHLGGGGHAAAAGATVNGSETDVRRRVLDAIERELEG